MPDPHATLKETAARFRAADLDSLAEDAERYAGKLARNEEPGESEAGDIERLLRLAQHPSVREAKAEK